MIKPRIRNENQLSLFDAADYLSAQQSKATPQPEISGSLNIDLAVRELISAALKATTLSRYQVAGEMAQSLGREVTKGMLDSWSAESRDQHRFPLAFLPAFARATGDRHIIRKVCATMGMTCIDGRDNLRLELSRVEENKRAMARRERALRDLISSEVQH